MREQDFGEAWGREMAGGTSAGMGRGRLIRGTFCSVQTS